MTGWAGINWRNGVLIRGKRYQRTHLTVEFDLDYNEDLYSGLW